MSRKSNIPALALTQASVTGLSGYVGGGNEVGSTSAFNPSTTFSVMSGFGRLNGGGTSGTTSHIEIR